MPNVNAAIIGLGYWGPNLLRNFSAAENCTVKYGCDLGKANCKKLAALFPSVTFTQELDDVLTDDEVDLVLIATPTQTHAPLAKRVLEAGKHVFIEKPMASSSAEAKQLNDLAIKQGKKIFVDHTFVFAPAVQKMADLVKEGSLGDLLYFDSSRINLGLIQKDCNVLWDLAVHDLSILSAFADLSTVETVAAHGSAHFGEQQEVGHLHLGFASGFQAHIHVSWLAPVKIRHTILGGTKAMVTYDDTEPSEKIRIYDKGVEHDGKPADPFFPKYRAGDVLIPALDSKETLAIEAEQVIKAIADDGAPPVSGQDGENLLRILEAADESLKTNIVIQL